MAVYHTSFNYLGINSRLKNLIIATFDADQGEVETGLVLEPIYADSSMNLRRHDFGSKWSSVSTFRITVVKPDGGDFSVAEVRNHLKWLTGTYQNTTLELLVGESIKCVFIGRFTNCWQYKMDARTVGLVLEFTSSSPFAYSPKQTIQRSIDGVELFQIYCSSDDLFSSVYLNVVYNNTTGKSVKIENTTIEEYTEVLELGENETITISSPNAISSDNQAKKTFGSAFNLVFPRLNPGFNEIQVTGTGDLTLEYSYPIKIGNVAVDLEEILGTIDCESNPGEGTVVLEYHAWENIYNKPTTLEGFGITNAYNKSDVDSKFAKVHDELDDTRTTINDKIDQTKSDLNNTINSTKSELNTKIDTTKTELTTSINDVSMDLANTKTALEKADADNKKELEEQIDQTKSDLNAHIKDNEADINALEAKDTDLQNQINVTNASLNTAKDELNASITNLQNSVYTKTEVDSKVSSVYKYMGSVPNEDDLPKADLQVGYVYNVEDTGMNVAWNGSTWDNLGSVVDLSSYATITELNNVKSELEQADNNNKSALQSQISYATSVLRSEFSQEYQAIAEDISELKNSTYTKTEVDALIDNIDVTDTVYTKEEIDIKLDNIASTGVDINEQLLNDMLSEVLV